MTARVAGLLAIITWIAVGCCRPNTAIYPPRDPSDTREIYIVNNHWHTGFVLRYAKLPPRMRELLKSFRHERFVEIGWGDDAFYMAPEATSGLAMHAMFASRGTVLHVAGFDEDDPLTHYANYHVDLFRVRVSREGYARLMSFLAATFEKDSLRRGASIELRSGLYGFSRFYRARGRYGAIYTCNNWTADGLRTTGFPISPFYAQSADNVGWQIKRFGRAYQRDIPVVPAVPAGLRNDPAETAGTTARTR